jgi:hypothetical protein
MPDPLGLALSSLQMAETAAKTLVRGASPVGIAELRSTATGIVEALIDVRVALNDAVAERQSLVNRIEALKTSGGNSGPAPMNSQARPTVHER